jgi:hypothetical protein
MAGVHEETLLVFDVPAEQVVSDCRRLAAQLLYLVPFVHPRQVDEHVRMAHVFFFQLTSARPLLLFASQKLHGNLDHRCLRSVRHSLICFTYSLKAQSTDTSFTC